MKNIFFVIKGKSLLYVTLTVIFVLVFGILAFSLSGAGEKALNTVYLPVTSKVILIDPGHGGIDAGSSANGVVEKEINLDIAKKLQQYIETGGGVAYLTRTEDVSTADKNRNKNITQKKSDLAERKKMIESKNTDIFISIHMNKFGQEKYYGAQVFYPEKSNESKKLGECIQKSLKENLDITNNRKAKADNKIFVLKNNKKPSVLIECGFLSNKSEADKFKSEEYRKKTAWAIYIGLINYLNSY